MSIAFWGVQPGRFVEALREANLYYLLPASMVLLLGLFIRSLGWRALLGYRVALARVFGALNQGYLLNSVLPFRLGELARVYLVSRGGELSAADALSSVVLERLIDVLVNLLALLAALPYLLTPRWAQTAAWIAGIGFAGAAISLAALLRFRPQWRGIASQVLGSRFPSLIDGLERFLTGASRTLREPGRVFLGLVWISISWLMMWIQIWLLLAMFGERSAWNVPLFATAVLAFGAAVPSSPGALGVYEVTTMAGLLVFGVQRESAIGVALSAHALQWAMTGLLGAVALTREGDNLMDLAAKARSLVRGRGASAI